jgi:hypothetical protein
MLPTVYNECDIITSRRNGVFFITEEINFACKNTSQNITKSLHSIVKLN